MEKKPKTKVKSKNHQVIEHFLDVEKGKGDKFFWGREMKISGWLLKKYPLDFLIKCPQPLQDKTQKIPSLAWLISENGKLFLRTEFFEYTKRNTNLCKERKEIVLSETKIGEDIIIRSKPKSLKEFLNYGQSKDN